VEMDSNTLSTLENRRRLPDNPLSLSPRSGACMTVYNGQDYIIDYKTTTSCEDGAFERACYKYGYKLQAAMYADGAFNSQMIPYRFAFVAQEKTPPYAVRVYFCDDGFMGEGAEIFHELMGIYHKCRVLDEWPGYDDAELFGDERR